MAFRDDMIAIADAGRDIAVDLGLRLHTVIVRTRTWDGDEVGRGTATDVDLVLEPAPKVRAPTPKEVATSGGIIEEGDRMVDRISATYTRAQLDGRPIAAATEVFWLIDGDPYRLVQEPREGFLGWSVTLRRMRNR